MKLVKNFYIEGIKDKYQTECPQALFKKKRIMLVTQNIGSM